MDRTRLALCGAVALLVVTAGCVRTEPGSRVDVSYLGSMNASGEGFHMEGRLVLGGGSTDRDVYHNVTVALYAANGTRLHTEPLGNLTPDPTWRLGVSVSTARVPAYVTFDSPEFREDGVTVTYYCRTEGEYVARRATAGSDVREVCG